MLKLKLVKGKCLIFVNDLDRCYRLKLFLEQFSIKSCVLNSELPLNSRFHIVQEFNRGVYDYIIATDESGGKGEADSDVEETEDEAEAKASENESEDESECTTSDNCYLMLTMLLSGADATLCRCNETRHEKGWRKAQTRFAATAATDQSIEETAKERRQCIRRLARY